MKKLMKILFYTLSSLILLILIFLFFLSTDLGLRSVIDVVRLNVPGVLTVKKSEGNILKAFTLEGIHYHNTTRDIQLDKIHIDWKILSLLKNRLEITTLKAGSLNIQTKPSSEKSQATTLNKDDFLIDLPIDITLTDISLEKFSFNQLTLKNLKLKAYTSKNKLYLSSLTLTEENLTLHSTGTFYFKPNPSFENQITITGKLADGKIINSKISLAGDLNRLLLIAKVKQPFTVNFRALLEDPLTLGHLTLQADWKNVIWPIDELQTINSETGTLSLQGSLASYQATLNTKISGSMLPKTDINLTASGNKSQLKLHLLEIDTLDGKFMGDATVQWEPTWKWQAKLTVENINPAAYWHDWPGNISFKFSTEGEETNKETFSMISLKNIQGSLRDHPLDGNMLVETHDREITLTDTHLKLGEAILNVDGKLTNNWDFTWQLNIPQLYTLTPYGGGNLKSEGKLFGPLKTPTIQADVSADKFVLGYLKIRKLSSAINLSLEPNQPSTLSLDAEQLHLKKQLIHSLNINLKGTTKNHVLTTNMEARKIKIHSSIEGQYQNGLWQGLLTQFNVKLKDESTWKLINPAQLKVSANQFSLSPLQLISGKQSLLAQGTWEKTRGFSSKINAKNLQLSHFNQFIPYKLSVKGTLDANLNISKILPDQAIYADLQSIFYAGELNYTIEGKKHALHYSGGKLDLLLDKKGLKADATIKTGKTTPINLTLALPGYTAPSPLKPNQAVKANLLFATTHLDLLPQVINQIAEASGTLTSDLTVTGTLGTPLLGGHLSLEKGYFTVPQFGLELKDTNILLEGQKNNTIKVNANAKSGEGSAKLAGTLTFSELKPQAVFTLTGQKFQIINTPEYKVDISPNLNLQYHPPNLKITGDLHINKADIQPKDFSTTETLPENVRYINGKEEEEKEALQIESQLNITLEDGHVVFKGLDTNLTGELALDIKPNQPILATGQLTTTKGSYQTYGQTLTIQKGQLLYRASQLDNPGISIRATRTIKSVVSADTTTAVTGEDLSQPIQSATSIQTITVGIEASGTLDDPRITLFSIPAGLSQADILSYLITGQPQSGISGAESTLLLQAVSSLNFGGSSGNHVADELQQTLGLTELTFASTPQINPDSNQAEDNTSLVVGKRLSKKMLVEYSVGLVVPVNVLRLIYSISNRWAVQTETSSYDTGADVLYTIEKD